MRRPFVVIGGTIVTGGLVFVVYGLLFGDVHTFKDLQPDEPAPAPGKTGWRAVDALLPKLRAISSSTGIPLGLLVAWIAKESGGRLADTTKLDERGYFQLMPAESKSLGLDHARLSTDSDYSLDAGVKLIRQCQSKVSDLNVVAAPAGSSFAWLLCKLVHTVGGGQTRKWVKAAQAAGAMDSWSDFETFVLGKRWAGPQPKKWLPFLDKIYTLGRPFGFGSEGTPLVSGLPSGACIYCVDGYHNLCDGADGMGPCACQCRSAGGGFYDPAGALPPFNNPKYRNPPGTIGESPMAGLDFLGAS